MLERRLLVHTPAVQKAYMDGRLDVYILDKRRLAAGDRKRGGRGVASTRRSSPRGAT